MKEELTKRVEEYFSYRPRKSSSINGVYPELDGYRQGFCEKEVEEIIASDLDQYADVFTCMYAESIKLLAKPILLYVLSENSNGNFEEMYLYFVCGEYFEDFASYATPDQLEVMIDVAIYTANVERELGVYEQELKKLFSLKKELTSLSRRS